MAIVLQWTVVNNTHFRLREVHATALIYFDTNEIEDFGVYHRQQGERRQIQSHTRRSCIFP